MFIHSVKTRFTAIFLVILALFVIQLPIFYYLINDVIGNYALLSSAGSLGEKAVSLPYLLNRHIMNGEAGLKKEFHEKKNEYEKSINSLRDGSGETAALTDPKVIEKFEVVVETWSAIDKALDDSMEAGTEAILKKVEVETSTLPIVEEFNSLIDVLVELDDPAFARTIDIAGRQRYRSFKMSYLMERYFISYDDTELVTEELFETIENFEESMAELKTSIARARLDRDMLGMITEIYGEIEKNWEKRKDLVISAVELKDTFYESLVKIDYVYTPRIVKAIDEFSTTIAAHARNTAMKVLLLMAATILFSAVLVFLFMWLTNKHLIGPLFRIKDTVEAYARGELTTRVDQKTMFFGIELKDEVRALGDSLNELGVQMSSMIGRIADSSNQLASAGEKLSESSGRISEGADRQSLQTGQIATAMEEMTASAMNVAKNSQYASKSVTDAHDVAKKGGLVAVEATAAIKEVADSTTLIANTIKNLGQSSEEIGTIISVINDIADQTNLLALNAAIEAARAGEMGHGFAVVADEVRKLAERTTKATKEIGSTIKMIQDETTSAIDAIDQGADKVEKGVKLADEAGKSLNHIVSDVENVTDVIGQIATAAEEQSLTADEVSRNMEEVAAVSRINLDAVNEVARATDDLATLAFELRNFTLKFKVSDAREPLEPVALEGSRAAGLSLHYGAGEDTANAHTALEGQSTSDDSKETTTGERTSNAIRK